MEFLDAFRQELVGLVAHCSDIQTRRYTPSDFPLVPLSQDDIDLLQDSPGQPTEAGIAALLPLTELQNALLIHRRTQARDEGNYVK